MGFISVAIICLATETPAVLSCVTTVCRHCAVAAAAEEHLDSLLKSLVKEPLGNPNADESLNDASSTCGASSKTDGKLLLLATSALRTVHDVLQAVNFSSAICTGCKVVVKAFHYLPLHTDLKICFNIYIFSYFGGLSELCLLNVTAFPIYVQFSCPLTHMVPLNFPGRCKLFVMLCTMHVF
jgi:hypothetical protein